jgi:hypothetical protein
MPQRNASCSKYRRPGAIKGNQQVYDLWMAGIYANMFYSSFTRTKTNFGFLYKFKNRPLLARHYIEWLADRPIDRASTS